IQARTSTFADSVPVQPSKSMRQGRGGRTNTIGAGADTVTDGAIATASATMTDGDAVPPGATGGAPGARSGSSAGATDDAGVAGGDGRQAGGAGRQSPLTVHLADTIIVAGPRRHRAGDEVRSAPLSPGKQVQLDGLPKLQDGVVRLDCQPRDVGAHPGTLPGI